MKDGFIKTAAATPTIKPADCEFNCEKIIEIINNAHSSGVSLLCLPELCITGYTCGDLFFQQALINGALNALTRIAEATAGKEIFTVVGLPMAVNGKLYNCAAALFNGKILGVIPKTNLPNYGEHNEVRWFAPAPAEQCVVNIADNEVLFGTNLLFRCTDIPDLCIGIEICEDLWVAVSPAIRHTMAGATVIANPSAGCETIGKADYRRSLVAMQSAKLNCGYIYANAGDGESTTDLVFSGHSFICENGTVLAESELFENSMIVSEIDIQRLAGERKHANTCFSQESRKYISVPFALTNCETTLTRRVDPLPFVPSDGDMRASRCSMILKAQAMGLKTRIERAYAKTAVIGISGGLDSCLALLVTVRAMDILGRSRKDVIAVTMPCFGTTKRTRSNAEILCSRLGVTFRCIDISTAVLQHFNDIEHDKNIFDVTYENSQARERTQILMDIANKENGLVIGTGDLSELALGFATYNGDHMSMYGVNASVPKTLMRHLVRFEADSTSDEHLAKVLYDILETPVSPELLPAENDKIGQKTESIVGPYELHDFFLYNVVRFGFTPAKIYRLAKYAFNGSYGDEEILKWLKLFYSRFFSQQFKRSCMPDGPKVGSVTLSPRGDWHMPSDASASLWKKELESL